MLNGSITYVIVIVWGLWALRNDRIERESSAKLLVSLVFAFYISRLLAVTFFPFPTEIAIIEQNRAISDAGFGPGNNFVPFDTVLDAARTTPTFINQIVGNFLLLLPLGFLAPLLSLRFTKRSNVVGLILATTFGIEFLQLAISTLLGYSYRSFDVDDLWLNTIGGITGMILAGLVFGKAPWFRPGESGAVEQEAGELTSSRETVPYRSAHG